MASAKTADSTAQKTVERSSAVDQAHSGQRNGRKGIWIGAVAGVLVIVVAAVAVYYVHGRSKAPESADTVTPASSVKPDTARPAPAAQTPAATPEPAHGDKLASSASVSSPAPAPEPASAHVPKALPSAAVQQGADVVVVAPKPTNPAPAKPPARKASPTPAPAKHAAPVSKTPSHVSAQSRDQRMASVVRRLVSKGETAYGREDYSSAITNARAALDVHPGYAPAERLLRKAKQAQQQAMNSISIH